MSGQDSTNQLSVVKAQGEEALFGPGDKVAISVRFPIGHYCVPKYIRGKRAVVEALIPTPAVNNEEEAFGRNAGMKRHYYRVLYGIGAETPTQLSMLVITTNLGVASPTASWGCWCLRWRCFFRTWR